MQFQVSTDPRLSSRSFGARAGDTRDELKVVIPGMRKHITSASWMRADGIKETSSRLKLLRFLVGFGGG